MISPNHAPSPPRDPYTEADHDRALSRLMQDIEDQDAPRPWDHEADPVVRDCHGDPVDLGEPWTRRRILAESAWLLLAGLVTAGIVGAFMLLKGVVG